MAGFRDVQAVVRCWTALVASHQPGKPSSGGNQSGPLDPWGQQVLRILGSCHRILSRALDCFEEDAWRGVDLPPFDGVLTGVPARLSGAAALPTLIQRLEGWLALLSAMLRANTTTAVTVPMDLLLALAQRMLALRGFTRTVPHVDHGHVHAVRALFPLLHRHALELVTAALACIGPHALPAAGTVAAWATDVVTSTSPVAAPLREAAWKLWASAVALTRVGLDAAESSRTAEVSAAMVRDLAGVSALLGVGLDGSRSELASLAQAGKTEGAASEGALTAAGAVALLDGACFLRTQGVAASWAYTEYKARRINSAPVSHLSLFAASARERQRRRQVGRRWAGPPRGRLWRNGQPVSRDGVGGADGRRARRARAHVAGDCTTARARHGGPCRVGRRGFARCHRGGARALRAAHGDRARSARGFASAGTCIALPAAGPGVAVHRGAPRYDLK